MVVDMRESRSDWLKYSNPRLSGENSGCEILWIKTCPPNNRAMACMQFVERCICFAFDAALRHQVKLWGSPDTPEREALMSTIDAINRRYGHRTVQFAASGVEQEWQMRSDMKSRNYTTAWSDLIRAVD